MVAGAGRASDSGATQVPLPFPLSASRARLPTWPWRIRRRQNPFGVYCTHPRVTRLWDARVRTPCPRRSTAVAARARHFSQSRPRPCTRAAKFVEDTRVKNSDTNCALDLGLLVGGGETDIG
jgi:hypothetical protein